MYLEALHLRDVAPPNHYILPNFHEDHPDVVLIHIGSNDINNQMKDRINTEKLTGDIINIGKSCIDLGVKEVVISSILPKKNIALYGRWTIISEKSAYWMDLVLSLMIIFQEHIYGKMGYI